jgi:MoaA/NifB/PqqE/SkfB family radical SAM enzyme
MDCVTARVDVDCVARKPGWSLLISHMVNALRKLVRLPGCFWDSIQYHLAGTFFTAKPRMIQFPVCDRCNARCIMCNRWSKEARDEIVIEKIREIFQNRLFSKVEQVNLHGGEPTLRNDLAEICRIVQACCPKLRRIWISTNGFGARRIEKRMLEVLGALDFRKLSALEINLSIDGIGETHDRIRGIKGGFEQAIRTLAILKRLTETHPVRLTIGTVIQPLNLKELDEIDRFGASQGIPVLFQPLMFDEFFNLQQCQELRFSKEDKEAMLGIIEKKLSRGSSPTSFYWCDFLAMSRGKRRMSPCAFDRYVLSLYPTGEVLPCSREDWIIFGNVYEERVDKIWYSPKADAVRRRMKKEVCPNCSAYCAVEFSLQKEFARYFAFYLRRLLSRNSRSLGL